MTVVVAAIIRKGNKIFIAQRPEGKSLAGFWEFPGGKQEQNETLPETLQRELREELNINVEVGDFFMKSSYQYEFGDIDIYSYWVDIDEDVMIVSNEHQNSKWVEVNELVNYKFAPADIPIVKKLFVRLDEKFS